MAKRLGKKLSTVALTGSVLAASVFAVNASSAEASVDVTTLTFDFPVSVSGPVAAKLISMVNNFNKHHHTIHVNPVFAGNYQNTMTKVQTSINAGKAPDCAVLLSTDMYTLHDMNAIVPIEQFAKGKDLKYLHSFYPAFLKNATLGGKTWSVPFQRSTIVLYYNKDLFKAAGISKAPSTWAELVNDGHKLTKSGQWGVEIPTSGTSYWNFQAFPIENGQNVIGDAANKVYFNNPKVVDALQFMADLSNKEKIEPTGLVDWGTAPTDFTAGKVSMIYHSSGSLASILSQAKFDVGVAMLPGNKQMGTPTGGGNFYIFKTDPKHEQAAYDFINWMTQPANAADWSMATGYVGVTPAAYDTPAMKAYLAKTPQAAVARDQLKYAEKELGTHQSAQVQQFLSTAVQAAVTGSMTPQAALDQAQKQADALLSKYDN